MKESEKNTNNKNFEEKNDKKCAKDSDLFSQSIEVSFFGDSVYDIVNSYCGKRKNGIEDLNNDKEDFNGGILKQKKNNMEIIDNLDSKNHIEHNIKKINNNNIQDVKRLNDISKDEENQLFNSKNQKYNTKKSELVNDTKLNVSNSLKKSEKKQNSKKHSLRISTNKTKNVFDSAISTRNIDPIDIKDIKNGYLSNKKNPWTVLSHKKYKLDSNLNNIKKQADYIEILDAPKKDKEKLKIKAVEDGKNQKEKNNLGDQSNQHSNKIDQKKSEIQVFSNEKIKNLEKNNENSVENTVDRSDSIKLKNHLNNNLLKNFKSETKKRIDLMNRELNRTKNDSEENKNCISESIKQKEISEEEMFNKFIKQNNNIETFGEKICIINTTPLNKENVEDKETTKISDSIDSNIERYNPMKLRGEINNHDKRIEKEFADNLKKFQHINNSNEVFHKNSNFKNKLADDTINVKKDIDSEKYLDKTKKKSENLVFVEFFDEDQKLDESETNSLLLNKAKNDQKKIKVSSEKNSLKLDNISIDRESKNNTKNVENKVNVSSEKNNISINSESVNKTRNDEKKVVVGFEKNCFKSDDVFIDRESKNNTRKNDSKVFPNLKNISQKRNINDHFIKVENSECNTKISKNQNYQEKKIARSLFDAKRGNLEINQKNTSDFSSLIVKP